MNHEFLIPGDMQCRVTYDSRVVYGRTVHADPNRTGVHGVALTEDMMRGLTGVWLDVPEPPQGGEPGVYYFFSQDLPPSGFLRPESLDFLPTELVDLPMETAGQVEIRVVGEWMTLLDYFIHCRAVDPVRG